MRMEVGNVASARKHLGVNHQAGELPVLSDIRIRLACKALEVRRLARHPARR